MIHQQKDLIEILDAAGRTRVVIRDGDRPVVLLLLTDGSIASAITFNDLDDRAVVTLEDIAGETAFVMTLEAGVPYIFTIGDAGEPIERGPIEHVLPSVHSFASVNDN